MPASSGWGSLPSPDVLATKKELNLFSKDWVDDQTMASLAECMRGNTSLTFIGFRSCPNVGDEGASSLATVLQSNKTLKKLSLESTKLGDRGAVALARAVPMSGLIRLDLGYTLVSDEGAAALADMIAATRTLATLVLDHCKGVTDNGVDALIRGLESNTTITVLGLKGTSATGSMRAAIDALLRPAARDRRVREGPVPYTPAPPPRSNDGISSAYPEKSPPRSETSSSSNRRPEEKRVDPSDGVAYTREEFLEEYGALDEWEAAGRALQVEKPANPSRPSSMRRPRSSDISLESLEPSGSGGGQRSSHHLRAAPAPPPHQPRSSANGGRAVVEMRIDDFDGEAYDIKSFLDEYGDLTKWNQSRPAQQQGFPPSRSPPPQQQQQGGGGGDVQAGYREMYLPPSSRNNHQQQGGSPHHVDPYDDAPPPRNQRGGGGGGASREQHSPPPPARRPAPIPKKASPPAIAAAPANSESMSAFERAMAKALAEGGAFPEGETGPAPGELVTCAVCSRQMTERALQAHSKACGKVRKKFDSKSNRVSSEAAQLLKGEKKKKAAIAERKIAASKGKWKAESNALREAMKASRGVAKAQKNGTALPPPVASAPDPSLVQCPHCSRRFNEKAAERHIPKCADIKAKPTRLKRGAHRGIGSTDGKKASNPPPVSRRVPRKR